MPTGYPTYLQVNNDGTVTAIFSGGVQLTETVPTGSGPFGPGNSLLKWADSNGVVREFLQGIKNTHIAVSHILNLVSQADTTDIASVTVSTDELGTLGSAAIGLNAQDNTGGPGQFRLLLNSQGVSNFLQNQGPSGGPAINAFTRAFNTPYQPNILRPTLVTSASYVQQDAAGTQAQVAYRVGPTSASVSNPFTGSFLVGIPYLITGGGGGNATIVGATFLVPAGWWYSIQNIFDPVAGNSVEFTTEMQL